MQRAWTGILLLLSAATLAVAAPGVVAVDVRAHEGWLEADIQLADLIDLRTASTIDSGLPGFCAYEVAVVGPNALIVGRRTWTLRLDHDLWEDRYLVTGPDGEQEVAGLAAMDSVCSRLEAVRLLPLDRLDPDLEYRLTVSVEVLPLASVDSQHLSRYLSRRGGGAREELDLDLGSLFGRLFKGGRTGRTTVAHTGPAFRPRNLIEEDRP